MLLQSLLWEARAQGKVKPCTIETRAVSEHDRGERTAVCPPVVLPTRFAQWMPNALTVSGGSLQNYLRSREELMQRANEVIAGVRALKLNIARVLPLAQAAEAH